MSVNGRGRGGHKTVRPAICEMPRLHSSERGKEKGEIGRKGELDSIADCRKKQRETAYRHRQCHSANIHSIWKVRHNLPLQCLGPNYKK